MLDGGDKIRKERVLSRLQGRDFSELKDTQKVTWKKGPEGPLKRKTRTKPNLSTAGIGEGPSGTMQLRGPSEGMAGTRVGA